MIAKAKAERQLVWYTGMVVSQVVRPLAEKFQAKNTASKSAMRRRAIPTRS
ncbi:hypothetical protein [Bosea thiooxidans]